MSDLAHGSVRRSFDRLGDWLGGVPPQHLIVVAAMVAVVVMSMIVWAITEAVGAEQRAQAAKLNAAMASWEAASRREAERTAGNVTLTPVATYRGRGVPIPDTTAR